MRSCLPGLTVWILGCVWLGVVVLGSSCAQGQTISAGYIQDALEAAELVTEAKRLRDDDDHRRAVERLQQAVDNYGDQLLAWPLPESNPVSARTDQGKRYGDTRWVIGQWLASDAALLKAYRQRYGPLAARLYEEAAGDLMQLQALAADYTVTQAGLRAVLDLAAAAVEVGDGHAATTRLLLVRWHPDRDRYRQRIEQLTRAGDLLRSEPGQSIEQNVDIKGTVEGITGPVDAVRQLPLLFTDGTDPFADPLWSLEMRRALARPVPATLNQSKSRASRTVAMQTPAVTLVGRVAVVSTPNTLIGVDAVAGRLLWRVAWADPALGGSALQGRNFSTIFDMPAPKAAAVGHGLAVAAMGGSVHRVPPKTIIPSELIAVDLETGSKRWGIQPGALDPRLEDGAFAAAPMIQGQTVVSAVLQQRGQQASTWLVGLNLADGSLKWARLMSTLTLRGFNTQGTLSIASVEAGVTIDDASLSPSYRGPFSISVQR